MKICEVVRCQVVGACVNSLAKQNRNSEQKRKKKAVSGITRRSL